MASRFYKSEVGESKKKHYHFVFSDDAMARRGENPLVTTVDNHTHQVIQNEDGSYMLSPDPADGHFHLLDFSTPYVPTLKKVKQTDEEIVGEVLHLYKTARELEYESRKKGRRSEEFYCGEQWDATVKQQLEDEGRACLVINFVQKLIDELCGHQSQNRTDIRYLPTEDGDQKVADILNVWQKNVLEQCYYEREEAKVFWSQVVVGRGAFNVYYDYSKSIEGEPVVESFQWDRVTFGPHEKEDLSDCDYLVKDKMFSLAKVKQLWPKKTGDFDDFYNNWASLTSEEDDTAEHRQYTTDQYLKSQNVLPMMLGPDSPMVDMAKKEIRVFECWRKVYQPGVVITNSYSEFAINAIGWSKKDLEQIQTLDGFFVIEKPIHKIRITRICGHTLLSDENPADLPVDDFFVVPVYAKRVREQFFGKVELAKDAQVEFNKRISQSVDIVNRMSVYGYFYDDTTFIAPEDEQIFKKVSGTAGFTQKVRDSDRPPRVAEGIKFPAEVVNMANFARENIMQMISTAGAEQAGANTSAQALMQYEKNKLIGTEYLFDNLSFAKKKLGRLLISICQKYYEPERIARIVFNQNQKSPVALAGQPLEQFDQTEIIKLLENADLSHYDVVVGEATWSPTQRLANLMVLTDLMNKGAPIPFEVVAEFMDLPEDVKTKMMQTIQMQQQQQAQAQQATAQAEIQKSLIGQGLIPPQILQEQGLAQAGPPQMPQAQEGPPASYPDGGIASI